MELDIIKKIIKQRLPAHANFQIKVAEANRYYRNENNILFKKPTEEDDSDNTPLRNADNRIPRNFHGLIVNQKASYAFTAPPMFDVGSPEQNKKITEVLGDEFSKNCMTLCVNAANACVGWVHYWADDDGFEWAVVDSQDILPIFDKGLKQKLLGVLRIYNSLDEDDGKLYTIFEYWTDTYCQAFRMRAADKIEDCIDTDLTYYNMFTDPSTQEPTYEYQHGFEKVPFIPFWNNNIHTDDLKNIKPLIDVYDKVFSGFINDLDDIQELIFILSGYGGTDLNGFLQDLKRYKTIKLDEDAEKPGVSTLNIEIPIEARNSVLDATRKAIFEQGQGFDPQPENFGNQSGEALKFMYSLLEMKTGLMETEFRIGFSKLIRAICKYKGIECSNIVQTWTRTRIKNDTELAQICRDSVGVVSQMTILKNHPFVLDAEAELEQIKKEKAEQKAEEDDYKNAFNSGNGGTGEGGDPIDEE